MSELLAPLQDALGDAYAVERELGGGGMSHVFLAEETALGRRVVIKVLPLEYSAGLSVERFRREIQLAARLQHPHIVPVLAAGFVTLDGAGVPYFTMPYVEGRSLRDRLRESGALPVREATRFLRQVAGALDYAHEHGVVHRDIKPDNILVSHDAAMVTDFGVAKALSASRVPAGVGATGEFATAPGASVLTVLGTSLGTPAYMAPEQAAADPDADHRADIYAFGATAYELLTGEPPFAGRSPQQLFVAHLVEAPAPLRDRRPEVPDSLAQLIERCLAKDPAARPQRAAEIAAILDDVPMSGVSQPSASVQALHAGAKAQRATTRVAPRTVAIGAVALAAAAGLATWQYARTHSAPTAASGTAANGSASAAPNATAAAPPISLLAVLPFSNAGGGADDEYFSDGMADELTSALSKVPGLRLAARSSAFSFKGRNLDAREIGHTLGVGAIVDGRVRRAGDRLRVSAELTSAADGLVLWSETYERKMTDVFSMQDELTRAITTALRTRLASGGNTSGTSVGEAPTGARGTNDLAAYDLYLRGRYFFNQRGADALRRAGKAFEQAVARDPKFARAHAGLADVAALLPVYSSINGDSAYQAARRSAGRAVELDSTLAEAHTTLGLAEMRLGRWTESERDYKRALSLDPRYAPAHQWYGELLIVLGRVGEAAEQMRLAAELDPLSPVIHAEQAYTLGLLRRIGDAERAGKRGIEVGPGLWVTHAFLGYAYLFNGRTADAVRELEQAAQLDSAMMPVQGTLAFTYAKAGDRARAQALTARLTAAAAAPTGSALAASLALLGAGDRDGGLRWLTTAADRHESWLHAFGLNSPFFDSVRSDPRFAAIGRTMGLDTRAIAAAH